MTTRLFTGGVIVAAVIAISHPCLAVAPGTLPFQGVLRSRTGTPVTSPPAGTAVIFSLYATATGGTAAWTENQAVFATNGLFTASLGSVAPFAASNIILDKPYWLGVKVAGEAAEMTPRFPLLSAPYALGAWSLGGNGGTGASAFLGTTDARPLSLKANGQRALALEYRQNAGGVRSVNVLAGSPFNAIADGVIGATIAGGGSGNATGALAINDVRGDFGVIGGGSGNFIDAAPNAVVAGGSGNIAQGASSVVGGGEGNNTQGSYSAIAGGQGNYTAGASAVVGGGQTNAATGPSSVIGGGRNNQTTDVDATVGGGSQNSAAMVSVVGGGQENKATGPEATVSGGFQNTAGGWRSTVGGGAVNEALADASTIAGGQANRVNGIFSTIAGGQANLIPSTAGSLNGGNYSTIGGGYGNENRGWYGFIGGGSGNKIDGSGEYSTIGGGLDNIALGSHTTIPGGYSNWANGTASFAAGYRAAALHDGSFVWSDASSDAYFYSSGANQFSVRATGGLVLEAGQSLAVFTSSTTGEKNRYVTLLNSPSTPSASGLKAGGILCADSYDFSTPGKNMLVVKGNAAFGWPAPGDYTIYAAGKVGGTQNWNASSDARLKANVAPMHNALESVMSLRGVTFDWRRAEYPDMRLPEGRHIGFIAQEMEKVLPEVVTTDAAGFKAISYGDVVPVLVEAVKTLKQQNDDLAARNKALEDRLDALARTVEQIQAKDK